MDVQVDGDDDIDNEDGGAGVAGASGTNRKDH